MVYVVGPTAGRSGVGIVRKGTVWARLGVTPAIMPPSEVPSVSRRTRRDRGEWRGSAAGSTSSAQPAIRQWRSEMRCVQELPFHRRCVGAVDRFGKLHQRHMRSARHVGARGLQWAPTTAVHRRLSLVPRQRRYMGRHITASPDGVLSSTAATSSTRACEMVHQTGDRGSSEFSFKQVPPAS